jgi:hypothetical protein
MNREQAIQAAQQIGVALGDTITVQNEGQIENPHDSGSGTHTDGWAVTHNVDGTWSAEKQHAY